MVIKSQHDIKKENDEKRNKVPKSMEKLAKQVPVKNNDPEQTSVKITQKKQPADNMTIDQKIAHIEDYLVKVQSAFTQLSVEITSIKNVLKSHDAEMSKITGDVVRLTSLEEDRYIELVTAFSNMNDKVELIDKGIPSYIESAINEYLTTEPLEQLEMGSQEQEKANATPNDADGPSKTS